jgi:F-type H+-transporting ATPase subunit epsilon
VKSFSLRLQDATHSEVLNDVVSFVGEDGSGSFGVQAGHGRIMTSMSFGLARFRVESGDWKYLALPGALLYFDDAALTLSTRHFVMDDDYQRISAVLREQLVAEEAELRELKESLRRMEEEVLRRIWQLGQAGSRND